MEVITWVSCDLGTRNYFDNNTLPKIDQEINKSQILEYSVILGSTTWLVDLKISYPTPLRGGNFGLFPHMKIARLNWDKMNTWTILTPSYPGVPLFPYFHKSHMCCATPLRSMVDDILMMICRRRPTKIFLPARQAQARSIPKSRAGRRSNLAQNWFFLEFMAWSIRHCVSMSAWFCPTTLAKFWRLVGCFKSR